MKRYEGKMIVTDLDGTFLGSHGALVPRNLEAVTRFCQEGGLFTFATGRHHDHLLEVIPDLRKLVNIPAIVANGSYLYDYATDRVLLEVFMDTDLTRKALLYARHYHSRVGFRVTTPQGFLTDGRTDYMQRFIAYSAQFRSYVVEVAPVERWIQRLWYKVVFRGACEDLDALMLDLKEQFGDVFEYNKSSETYFEMQRKGCSKGKMLTVLKKTYERLAGIPITAYGVGDYENDLTLLQAADVAVCPANAQEQIKAVADWQLCDHNEGVIADLIGKLS